MDKFSYDTDTWKVIKSYLLDDNYKNLIRHHLDSFNEFTDVRIEQIVKQSNPLLIFNNYDEESNTYKYEIQINLSFHEYVLYIHLIFL